MLTIRKLARSAHIAGAILLTCPVVQAQSTHVGPNAEQLRPAMLVWSIGTNRPKGPTRTVETVTRAIHADGQVWRITHYPHDAVAATTSEFDLYDVDAKTLTPIRSVMRNPRFELALTFGAGDVMLQRTEGSNSTREQFSIPAGVQGEGPGSTTLIASLPLREGYTFQYEIVDRWDGSKESRVKKMKLSVLGRGSKVTAMGPQDTFQILIAPADESFRIIETVRAQPPHYPLAVEYTRGKQVVLSEVTAFALQDG